jgi:beta propeller repeat protein
MKSKVIFEALVLMSLTGLMSTASIAQAGEEIKLVGGQSPDLSLICDTEIYGNLVTWYETATNGLNVYDRSLGRQLEISSIDAVSGDIKVYDGKIVWQTMGNNIIMYDVTTKKHTTISTNGSSPDITDKYILYQNSIDLKNEPYYLSSLYLYDLEKKKENRITDYTADSYKAAIYGNKVVWVRSSEPSTIYIYDIPSKKFSTTRSNGVVRDLDIHGNVIVWQSELNETNNIYMRDILTHKTTQITKSGTAIEPAIYGNRIVYINTSKYLGDVCLYDKSNGKTTLITNCGCAYAPSIFEDKIVYADSHEAGEPNWELGSIYLYNLSATVTKPTADKRTISQ